MEPIDLGCPAGAAVLFFHIVGCGRGWNLCSGRGVFIHDYRCSQLALDVDIDG
jgi:hypothetical protein